MKNIISSLIVVICFFVILALFVGVVIYFLPKNIAPMVIGLAGFTVIVVGPFWIMQLQQNISNLFSKNKKRRSLD